MKKDFKRALALLLALIFIVYIGAAPVEAATKKNGLKKVSITKVSKKINPAVSGVSYTIKWKKVSGAKGYQVKESAREMGEWFTSTKYTSSCSYKTGGSSIDTFKIKVRAYKIVNGKKKYGPWSKTKTIKVF